MSDPGLLRRVFEIGRRHAIFFAAAIGEIDWAGGVVLEVFPFSDELLVGGVELIGVGKAVLQPVPLRDGGFDKAGGRVGVVLEELDGVAIVREIESAVECGGLGVPRGTNCSVSCGGNAHLCKAVLVQNHVPCGECKALDLVGCSFEAIDFARGEFPVGGLVPIGCAVSESMVGESDLFDALLPVGSR